MKEIISILKKDKVISASDLSELLKSRAKVYELEREGIISKVYPSGLGYFTLPDIEEGEAQFAIVKKYYPQCVISGRTALSLYSLGQDYIREIDVDIPRSTNLSNELLAVHRVAESKINHVIERSFPEKGVPFDIRIYSPERVLHEAYKCFSLSDAFYRAIKRYRSKYLNTKRPADQYETILSINKTIGRKILNFLVMGDIDE